MEFVLTELLTERSDLPNLFGNTYSAAYQVNLEGLFDSEANGIVRFFLVENNITRGTRIELDNVVVANVAEPSLIALLGIGLLGLCLSTASPPSNLEQLSFNRRLKSMVCVLLRP